MADEKYRVLILDDDYELGELLREYLQNTSRCNVTYVNMESDFWERVRQEDFDILFLDYKLPNTTGLEILGRMSQAGITLPTVMMTGEGNENIAARAIQSGALDYLVKGEYSFTSLPPLIQKAVRLREMQRAMQQYLEQVRYQAMLLDNMRDAVVVWGLDGAITYWNSAAEALYGAIASERLGRGVNQVYFPCFDPPLTAPSGGLTGSYQIEHRYTLPDSSRIWISAHITTLYGEGKDPIGYMNVARDITPRKQEQEALIKSENFIKRILDTSPNIIYILDLASQRISYVNPEIHAILGYQVSDFTHATFQDFSERVHPDDRVMVTQHMRDLRKIRESQVLETEYRMRSQAGEWRWLKSRETAFSRGREGAPQEIIGVIQDITANKLAEERLQHRLNSEIVLSTVSNNLINLARTSMDQGVAGGMQLVSSFIQVDYGIIFLNEAGRLQPYYFASPRGTGSLTGVRPPAEFGPNAAPWLFERLNRQETVVISRLEDLPPDAQADADMIRGMGLRSMILFPMVFNNALYGLLGFGTIRELTWTEDDIYMLKTFSEMITNALVQKQVDQALRKSEARYRAIVEDHQTEMICRFLPDTTLTFVNEAYCRFYSQPRGQLVGASFLDPVLEDDRAEVQQTLSGLSTNAAVKIFEQRVRLPGGEVRWQEWVSRAIFDQHNDFIEFQAVGRDITERKAMEEKVKTAQTRLAQAARLASIGELAAGVAHQISNPLTTIIADAQILTATVERSHPARESADAILEAGWRAQRVINELMKFSQPGTGTTEFIDLNDTIDKALLLTSAHVQSGGVELSVDLAPDLPVISGNPSQLTDLWVNLLLLARTSFIDEGQSHRIHIASRKLDDGSARVEIRDDGIPIPPEQYDTIFEPQLIPTGSGRGTGMELSICRELARQNHAQISISGDGKETTFHITFATERP